MIWVPPRCLSAKEFHMHPTGRTQEYWRDDCPMKLRSHLDFPARTDGLPCLTCCHQVPNQDKPGKNGWMVLARFCRHFLLIRTYWNCNCCESKLSLKPFRCMLWWNSWAKTSIYDWNVFFWVWVLWCGGWFPASPLELTMWWSSLCANSHPTL